jgi:hypothetical protein
MVVPCVIITAKLIGDAISGCGWLRLSQRLLQVGDQVVGVLDPDR